MKISDPDAGVRRIASILLSKSDTLFRIYKNSHPNDETDPISRANQIFACNERDPR